MTVVTVFGQKNSIYIARTAYRTFVTYAVRGTVYISIRFKKAVTTVTIDIINNLDRHSAVTNRHKPPQFSLICTGSELGDQQIGIIRYSPHSDPMQEGPLPVSALVDTGQSELIKEQVEQQITKSVHG